MKNILTFITLLTICALTTNIYAQEKKNIRKEVRMEDENGVKTLYVTLTEDGKVTEEVYTGEEAETKLAEMMDGRGKTDEIKKEIEVEIIDGEKVVTIITSRKGKMRKEVYTGKDAEAKLEELKEAKGASQMKVETKQIEEK
jgi:hypothetical protein